VVSDERALALQLAGLDDARLAETFAARSVSAAVGWRDFFDAAEGLLTTLKGIHELIRA